MATKAAHRKGGLNDANGDGFDQSTQYPSQLARLTELFSPEWSEMDLIAALEEVQGDLDDAITRISEGTAARWNTSGKKGKKKDAKPSNTSFDASPALREPRAQRLNSDSYERPARGTGRGGRGGGRGGRGGRTGGGSNVYPRPPRPQNGFETAEARAAAAASGTGGADGSPETNAAPADELGSPAATTDPVPAAESIAPPPAKSPEPSPPRPSSRQSSATKALSTFNSKAKAAPASSSVPSTPASKPATSWAQLFKTPDPPKPVAQPPKPEESAQTKPTSKESAPTATPAPAAALAPASSPAAAPAAAPSPAPAPRQKSPSRSPSPAKKSIESPKIAPLPPAPVSPVPAPAPPIAAAISPKPKPEPSPIPAPKAAEPALKEVTAASPAPIAPPAAADVAPKPSFTSGSAPPGLLQQKPRTPAVRKLNQDAPVIMPTSMTPIQSTLRFGQFGLQAVEAEEKSVVPPSVTAPAPAPTSAAAAASQNTTHVASPAAPSPVQQPVQSQRPVQPPAQQQQLQQQQHTPQLPPAGPTGQLGQSAAVQQAAPGLQQVNQRIPTAIPQAPPVIQAPQIVGHLGGLPSEYGSFYGGDPQQAQVRGMGYFGGADPSQFGQSQAGLVPKYGVDYGNTTIQSHPHQANPPQAVQQSQPAQQAGGQTPPQQAIGVQQSQQPTVPVAAQQQGYAVPYGFYHPYYYQNMGYSSPGYGQPFVGKSLYPAYASAGSAGQQGQQGQQQLQPNLGVGLGSTGAGAGNNAIGGATGIGAGVPKGNAGLGSSGMVGGHQGYGYGGQPQLYQQSMSYDDLGSGLAAMGIGGGGVGVMDYSSGNKTGITAGGPGPGVPKGNQSVQNGRGPRGYESHSKYQGSSGGGPVQQSQGQGQSLGVMQSQASSATAGSLQGTGGGVGAAVGGGVAANNPGLSSSYYNQHHIQGMHPQYQGYPYQMNQGYQNPNMGYGRQQGQYWSGGQS
ncbi:hypothetical protein DFJ73DRAFT_761365 [Zopfochytrium polystomum]|nr:hypothetical protein DFJ73DRAFT_761365 [Zopfochytrium polystomum]